MHAGSFEHRALDTPVTADLSTGSVTRSVRSTAEICFGGLAREAVRPYVTSLDAHVVA
jgi:hypothetical protein